MKARAQAAAGPTVAALVAFLPYARGMIAGESFYFRDLARQFVPLRLFIVEGLRQAELRYWNPYVHEGEPASLPALGYPPDLLQALAPSPWGISLLLALHGPLAAVAMYLLTRGLGGGRVAATAAGIVYSLGGFFLSSLNLYVYAQAMAWAPLLILGMVRTAAGGGRRATVATGLVIALSLATTGLEVVAQALLIGAVLGLWLSGIRRCAGLVAAGGLGLGLAAYTLLPMVALVGDSARQQGFDTSVVLAHSIHPVTFLQVVVGGLYGDLHHLADYWWGQNFFPGGFPYILSLYLGATALILAGLGLRSGNALARPLALLAALGALVGLGRFAALDPLVDLIPYLNKVRFPTKAFFTVHLACSLLAALGIQSLLNDRDRRAWSRLGLLTLGLGVPLASAPLLARLAPGASEAFFRILLPYELAEPWRTRIAAQVLADAAMGGLAAFVAGLLALLVWLRRLRAKPAVIAVVALLATDLLRCGAGLNPTVTAKFFRLSEEMRPVVARLRESGGRIFTCEPTFSPIYHRARRLRPRGHELWTFAVNHELLSPYFNLASRIPSALTRDLTMLVPEERTLPPEHSGCATLEEVVPRLRAAGVSHVLGLTQLDHPDLQLLRAVGPARTAPLQAHLHALRDPLPLRAVANAGARSAEPGQGGALIASLPEFRLAGGVAIEGLEADLDPASGRLLDVLERPGRIELLVEASDDVMVVVRDAHAPGWLARLDGEHARLLRADGRHMAVQVPAGRSRVVLSYSRHGLAAGVAITLLCALGTAILLLRGRGTSRLSPVND